MPMAGRGSRFAEAGYHLPKPLIPVHGKPMIHVVVNNLRPSRPHRFIFLCRQEHLDEFGMREQLAAMAPGADILPVEGVTEGAACTVLLTKALIDGGEPLMIANSDQWVDIRIDDYLAAMDLEGADGWIMTMWSDDPKWSYVRFDPAGGVAEVVEKKVVSHEATVGIYNFARGRDFVEAAEDMIRKNLRVNNEFYVAPCYNELLARGMKLGIYNVGREYDGMYGMGIPSDLRKFEGFTVSRKATAFRRPSA
ncbi:MAG: glycosyltransferase family 2 protein [Verrucomicrobiota bacterium]|nr:glycosyltransferase family 2 protein [Verrucomicrobiota bacterium]